MGTPTLTEHGLDDAQPQDEELVGAPQQSRRLRLTLLAVIAVAVLVVAGAVGWVLNPGSDGSSSASMPTVNSVDAGFARDMSTHHTQAVTMAGYERDNTTNPSLKLLAFDIETSQQFQIGEMQGWLDTWGLSRNSTDQMAWMGHGIGPTALMPGMATAAQMTRLETLHGTALDVLFLQLMIHHHQGGVDMAQYARDHATEPYVVTLASSMYNLQSAELVQMEQLLRSLGGTPLPPPAMH